MGGISTLHPSSYTTHVCLSSPPLPESGLSCLPLHPWATLWHLIPQTPFSWHWWFWLAQLCLQASQTSEETLTCERSRRITQGSAVTNQSTAVQIPRAKYPNPQALGRGVYSLSLFFNLCLGPRHQSTKNLVWDTDLKSLRAPTKGSIFDTMILTIAVSWTCTHLYT